MKSVRPSVLAPVISLLLAAAVAAESGPDRLRARLSFTGSASAFAASWFGVNQFDDPADPPLAIFDIDQRATSRVGAGAGIELGFEYRFGNRLGVDSSLTYGRHELTTAFAGQVTNIPLAGQPPVPFPGEAETAPILGIGSGTMRSWLATVGLNFHLLPGRRVDLYAGPLIGYQRVELAYDSGGFQVEFSTFTSITRAAALGSNRSGELHPGALVGVEVPFGGSRWALSAAAKYLDGGPELDPWRLQAGVSYGF